MLILMSSRAADRAKKVNLICVYSDDQCASSLENKPATGFVAHWTWVWVLGSWELNWIHSKKRNVQKKERLQTSCLTTN